MKKLLALCIVLMVALSLPVFVSAEDEVPYVETTLFETDFDGESELSNLIDGNGIVDGAGTVLVPTHEFDEDDHKKVWKPQAANTYAATNLNSIPGTVIVEADFYFNSSYASNRNVLLYDEQFLDIAGSTFYFRSATKYQFDSDLVVKSGAVGEWFRLKIESNYADRTVKFYIDDVPVGETYTIPSSFTRFATKLRFYNGQAGTHEIYVDNIRIYNRVENYTVSGECTDAVDGAASFETGSEIVLTFSDNMKADTLVAGETVKLTNSYGAPVAFDGVYNDTDKTYTITTTEDMLPKTAHTVTLDGVKTADGGTAVTSTYDADGELLTNIATFGFTTGKPDFAITAVESTGTNAYNVTVQDVEDTGVGYIVATNYTAGVLTDITLVPADAATTYPVTLTTGGETTEFALLSNDGNFAVLDIWTE